VFRRELSGNLAGKIDRGRAEAMQIAAQFTFDQRRAAGHGTAAEIPFRGQMDFAVGSNRTAEARGDFVIAQINVLAALRANRRGRGGTDFLRGLAIKTLDDRAVVLVPKAFQLSQKGRISNGLDRFAFRAEPHFQLRSRRHKMRAALAAHCALRRRIFHLLEAAVRTIHTDFSRRRLGHGSRSQKAGCLGAGAESRLGRGRRRIFIPHNFRSRPSRTFARARAGHLGLTDKSGALFDDKPRRFQVALERATRFQFTTLAHGDVALDFAVNGNRFRFDLTADIRVLTDRQNAVGVDFTFDFAVDEQFLLKFDRAFNLDVAR